MFRRYSIAAIAPAAAAFLALLLVSVFLDLAQYRQQQIDQRASATAYYTYPAREQSHSLDATHPGIADLARHIGQADSAQEHERYTHNLQAQQDVALFTRALAWAAGIGLLVSGVGVALIFLTLKETRRAASDAANAYRVDRSAYLVLQPPVCDAAAVRNMFGGVIPQLTCVIRNVGRGPATVVAICRR